MRERLTWISRENRELLSDYAASSVVSLRLPAYYASPIFIRSLTPIHYLHAVLDYCRARYTCRVAARAS
eukprot:scaffold57710_cov62-Phaeocystis_antarctica.AAC.8